MIKLLIILLIPCFAFGQKKVDSVKTYWDLAAKYDSLKTEYPLEWEYYNLAGKYHRLSDSLAWIREDKYDKQRKKK